FLNPANHKTDIPLDYISYHFYAGPPPQGTITDWQYSFFQQADEFLGTVRIIETIRKNLSPSTKTDIDELGSILPTDAPPAVGVTPPAAYWNLSGAMYAYLYVELARLQIDVVGESQLVGFPTQYPSVSMMDWTTNQPNARFWVLKLLRDTFHPGDKMVETDLTVPNAPDLEAQAFITPAGHKLLLVNKRNLVTDVPLPDSGSATALTVDLQSGEGPARRVFPSNGKITLQPFAVTVVSWDYSG
ncbi:MAG: glycosyl hydrolase family 39, partial [Terracidiphilus sp.]